MPSSPGVGLSACDVLQLLLQHQELGEVSLLCLCGLLLVVSPEALHLLPVTLLKLELLHLFFGPQPLQFLTNADRWRNSLLFHIWKENREVKQGENNSCAFGCKTGATEHNGNQKHLQHCAVGDRRGELRSIFWFNDQTLTFDLFHSFPWREAPLPLPLEELNPATCTRRAEICCWLLLFRSSYAVWSSMI